MKATSLRIADSAQPPTAALGTLWSRSAGIVAGVVTHVLFGYTVWRLFWFLKGGAIGPEQGGLWIDAGLALQFVVPHSLLLHPAVRERLSERFIPSPFYGLFFCAVTCLGLLATICFWQPIGPAWWNVQGAGGVAVSAGFYGSWIALVYSLRLSGFGYQTGWTPWWHWVRHRPIPPRPFEPRGVFRWLRHPVYLSFLGLLWFTPVMTADRGILVAIWTLYVFAGSWLKDRRLVHYLGDRYREYQARVPGYPGMPWGPLARIPRDRSDAMAPAARTDASRRAA